MPDHPPAAGQLGQRGDLCQPLHHVLLIAAHCGDWLHLGEGGGGAGPGGAGSGLLAAVGAPAGEHGSVGGVAAARITYHCSVLLSAADLRPRSPHSQAQSPAWKVSPWQVLVQARLARQEGSSTQLAWGRAGVCTGSAAGPHHLPAAVLQLARLRIVYSGPVVHRPRARAPAPAQPAAVLQGEAGGGQQQQLQCVHDVQCDV